MIYVCAYTCVLAWVALIICSPFLPVQALGNLGEGEAIRVQCLVFDAVLRSSTLSPLSFVKVFGK